MYAFGDNGIFCGIGIDGGMFVMFIGGCIEYWLNWFISPMMFITGARIETKNIQNMKNRRIKTENIEQKSNTNKIENIEKQTNKI